MYYILDSFSGLLGKRQNMLVCGVFLFTKERVTNIFTTFQMTRQTKVLLSYFFLSSQKRQKCTFVACLYSEFFFTENASLCFVGLC